ncbi:unnamed protein product [Prunus armeniaca]|uniref:Uncharacterized protein n=1 Tax=Prunus armeniaca TaxID=36596 RepID=A0A6J5USJ6_PRUAR|nr:unnamed protein product [Prunus armeniaca]
MALQLKFMRKWASRLIVPAPYTSLFSTLQIQCCRSLDNMSLVSSTSRHHQLRLSHLPPSVQSTSIIYSFIYSN